MYNKLTYSLTCNVVSWSGLSTEDAIRAKGGGEECRKIVSDAANRRFKDDWEQNRTDQFTERNDVASGNFIFVNLRFILPIFKHLFLWHCSTNYSQWFIPGRHFSYDQVYDIVTTMQKGWFCAQMKTPLSKFDYERGEKLHRETVSRTIKLSNRRENFTNSVTRPQVLLNLSVALPNLDNLITHACEFNYGVDVAE